MKALRLTAWQSDPEMQEIPVPEPGPGEVLIRIGGAGACHSDLHLLHEWTPEIMPPLASWKLPMTLGHENAGWIEAGDLDGYPYLEQGAPVVVSLTWNCGVCASCRVGATNYCEVTQEAGGLGFDGGMAEFMVAPIESLVPLKDLEPWMAAPLTDAALTPYHAVKRSIPRLTPDATVVVIGVGGLGHMAVQLLREMCASRIIALDIDEDALALASEVGADICLPSDEAAAEEIRKATGGLGAMVVLDFVGINPTLETARQAARQRGEIVIVGIGGGALPVQFGALPYACSVVTTYGGSTGELAEVVAMAEAGRISPHIETFGLDEAADVYERLHRNEITGRAVIRP
ncbi:MAG: NAD(P)-dependent alcohol dehydrogenase [Gemmatimonadota bacterium]